MQNNNDNNQPSSGSGLVISYFGNSVAVEDYNGQVFQCHLRRNQELPLVGDRVKWEIEKGNTGRVIEIEPRRSLLARGDHRGRLKPLAANIDIILVVMAPDPIFSEYLVDRYLLAAELMRIQPAIVLNKIDLLDESALKSANERLKPYREIPYPVILSSIYTENGLQELSHYVTQKTCVLVGPSGVGKSSIIAKLGNEEIKVGDVTEKGGGKHTTTATRLYHLPQGGALIDSPGVREFNLWQVSQQEVLSGFKEFEPFFGKCKFRNCLHTVEPGCAIQAAVVSGEVSEKRFNIYIALMKEAKK